MKTFFITTLIALLVGCQTNNLLRQQSATRMQSSTSSLTYSGGDGLSIEQAVVITGARSHMAGIEAEYAWLRKHYPGFTRTRQTLLRTDNGRIYDLLDIVTSNGKTRSVFFDITSFFGKY